MKVLLWSAIGLLALSSCNQGPKHPQADLIQQKGAMAMSAQEILSYADAIDTKLDSFTKQSSLIFKTAPDESLHVVQYQQTNLQPIVYVEYVSSAGINDVVSTYYLKNDSLLLVSTQQVQIKNGVPHFIAQRTYLRNNIAFKREEKSAPDSNGLAQQRFIDKKDIQDKTLNPYQEKISMFKDALIGANKFDLIFDKLVQLPDAPYLLLKSKIPNGCSASIRVEESDQLIDSLQHDPMHFSASKINFKWRIKDHEAIYVPVAANLTSAKGLNK